MKGLHNLFLTLLSFRRQLHGFLKARKTKNKNKDGNKNGKKKPFNTIWHKRTIYFFHYVQFLFGLIWGQHKFTETDTKKIVRMKNNTT